MIPIYHFSQEDSFLKEREGSQPSELVGDELASNKGWQKTILIVRLIESFTPLPIEYMFGI